MKHINKYKIFETLNSRGSKSIEISEVKEIVSKNCNVWLNSNNKFSTIFRSQRNMGNFVYTDARGTYRNSIEPINLHIVLMDNLDCWKDYPYYSEAIIGLSNDTPHYGNALYEVVPFDNMKIGVCPSGAIWSSFSKNGFEFGQYIYATNTFLDLCNIDGNQWEQTGGGTIETRLKEMSVDEISSFDSCDFLNIMNREIGEGDYNGAQCFNFIKDYLFNPEKRGFSLHTYDENFELPVGKQVWCSGPVVLLKREAEEDYTKEWFKK